MNSLPNIHYITQDVYGKTHEELAEEACGAGVSLVQLRIKNRPLKDIEKIAIAVKHICDKHKVLFIVNDYVEIAKEIGADGVHLGNRDMNHEWARKLMGDTKIIGGTAYNIQEALIHFKNLLVDYIGVGTYRATSTKPEITKFISLAELNFLTQKSHSLSKYIPTLVIGGIRLNDIESLKKVGIYGVAVASLINKSKNKSWVVSELKAKLMS